MGRVEQKLSYMHELPLGLPRESWRSEHEYRLKKMGFNGERLSLVKYVLKDESGYCSNANNSTKWYPGEYTTEAGWTQDLIGNARGLYAADLGYFIKHRLCASSQPLLLVEMNASHFVDTNGEVVVASALKTLDVVDRGDLLKDLRPMYELAPHEVKRRLGQAMSWQEVRQILYSSYDFRASK